jgi:para-aminobenzoate synthetase component 1
VISDPKLFKTTLNWSQQFREVAFMDSNIIRNCIQITIACCRCFFNKTDSQNAFESLKQYQQTTKDWVLVIYHMILK